MLKGFTRVEGVLYFKKSTHNTVPEAIEKGNDHDIIAKNSRRVFVLSEQPLATKKTPKTRNLYEGRN